MTISVIFEGSDMDGNQLVIHYCRGSDSGLRDYITGRCPVCSGGSFQVTKGIPSPSKAVCWSCMRLFMAQGESEETRTLLEDSDHATNEE